MGAPKRLKKIVWKPVVGYEGFYEVSNHGKIRRPLDFVPTGSGSHTTCAGHVLKNTRNSHGYLVVGPSVKGAQKLILVHQLVAAAFLGPCPEGMQINHIDCNKMNNRAENLEYVTQLENVRHAVANGRVGGVPGERHVNAKLTRFQVRIIKRLFGYVSQVYISKLFGVDPSTVSDIYTKRTWRCVEQRADAQSKRRIHQ